MERRITALKAQKKNPNRINVYLDGEFAFGLAKIVAAWLHIGQELSAEKIEQLQAQDELEVAYQRALRFLNYRPRSETEIQRKLAELGFSEAVATEVLERLRSQKFVGDHGFARDWVENRSTFRPRSHRMLAVELRRKGIDDQIIEETLAGSQPESELAYQAAEKYAHRLENLEWEDFRRRLGGFLGRRGFSYGISAPVIQRIWNERISAQQIDNEQGKSNGDV